MPDSSNSNEPNCETHLIPDEPSTSDAFGGAYERVAQAAADMIRKEPGGKTIGLEGGWGTGKSTIVGMVRAKLQQDQNTATWIYDAWAHEGDLLRRTFLEDLIGFLQSRHWIDRDKWQERKDSLTRRVRVSEQTTTRVPTALAGALAVAATSVPVGAAVLAAGLGDPRSGVLVVLGSVLSSLWVIVAVGALILRRLRGKIGIELFTQSTRTRTETVDTPDPSSIEFEQMFGELLASALGEATQRRLLVVIDNLDRVDPSEARSIWATLQTFLGHGQSGEPASWLSRLWVLVPHDRGAMERLWVGSPETATSFVDKRLQARFFVPPATLSEWRTYLIEILRDALPQHHGDQEFVDVYQVFRLTRPAATAAPSPREVKLFVNGVGTLHRQWQHAFPLSLLAYFHIIRGRYETHRELADAIVDGSVPEASVRPFLGSEFQEAMAALVYNTDPLVAGQLLLRPPIDSAMVDGDGRRLSEIHSSTEGSAAFWSALEDSSIHDLTRVDLAKAAVALQVSGLVSLEGDHPRSEMRVLLSKIRRRFDDFGEWKEVDAATREGMIALVELFPEEAVARRLLDGLGGAGVDEPLVADWLSAVLAVLHVAEAKGLTGAVAGGFTLPFAPELFIRACAELARSDEAGEFWHLVSSKTDTNEVVSRLVDSISKGESLEDTHDAVRVLATSSIPLRWPRVIDAMAERLATPLTEVPEALSLMENLWNLRDAQPDPTRAALADLAQNGVLFHYLEIFRQAADWPWTAFVLYLIIRANPQMPDPPGIGQAQQGHGFIYGVLSSPEGNPDLIAAYSLTEMGSEGSLGNLFRLAKENANANKFVAAVIKAAGSEASSVRDADPQSVMANWKLLAEGLGDDFTGLLRRHITDGGLLDIVRSTEFDSSDIGLYLEALEAGAVDDDEFVEWLTAGLMGLKREDWLTRLRQAPQQSEVDVVMKLGAVGHRLNGLPAYVDALAELGSELASQDTNLMESKTRWGRLVAPLGGDSVLPLRRKLFDHLIQSRTSIPPHYFELHSQDLLDARVLQSHHQTFVFFEELLDQRHTDGLGWVAEFLEVHPRFAGRYRPADTVEFFRRKVQAALQAERESPSDPQLGELLRRIEGSLDKA